MRAVSSRALGALVRGMGEESFEDLLPWLMETLTSENSSVDRSGAAQGNLTIDCKGNLGSITNLVSYPGHFNLWVIDPCGRLKREIFRIHVISTLLLPRSDC